MDDLDLRSLGDIPDPFARGVERSPRPPSERPTPSPSRAGVRGLRAAAVAIALLSEVAWLTFVEHRDDLAGFSFARALIALGIPLFAAVVALAAAARKGALGLGESSSRLASLVGLSVTIFTVGTLIAAPRDEGGPFWGHVLSCVGVTAALSAIPLALGLWSFRHAFVAAARWRSAAIGVAAGALAAATMSLACATDGAAHVLLGHGAMMLVGGAVAVALGRAMRA